MPTNIDLCTRNCFCQIKFSVLISAHLVSKVAYDSECGHLTATKFNQIRQFSIYVYEEIFMSMDRTVLILTKKKKRSKNNE